MELEPATDEMSRIKYLHPYANVLVEEVLDGNVSLYGRTHHHTGKVKTEGIWITKQHIHP